MAVPYRRPQPPIGPFGPTGDQPYLGFQEVAPVQGVGAGFDPTAPIGPTQQVTPEPIQTFMPTSAPASAPAPTGESGGPTAASVASRHKLAAALMGDRQQVNHPMQAVANAVSQIAGSWLEAKANKEENALALSRRDRYRKALTEGGSMEDFGKELMMSEDPDDIEYAIKILTAAASKGDDSEAPTTKDVWEGTNRVTKQWNPKTREWETMSTGHAWSKGRDGGRRGGGSDEFDPTDDPDQIGGAADGPGTGRGGAPTGGKVALPQNIKLVDGRPHLVKPDGTTVPTEWPSAARYRGRKGAMEDQDMVDVLAYRLLSGDPKWSSGIGKANASIQVAQINHRAREIGTAKGWSNEEIASRTSGSAIEYAGAMTGQRTTSRLAATSSVFVEAARGFSDVVKAKSSMVKRSQFVPWNKAQQMIDRNMGDPDIVAFDAAVTSFVQAYAKAVSPQGAPTEGSRQHAYDMLQQAYTQEQFDAVMETLDEEMVNEQRRLEAKAAGYSKEWQNRNDGRHDPTATEGHGPAAAPGPRLPSDVTGRGKGAGSSMPVKKARPIGTPHPVDPTVMWDGKQWVKRDTRKPK